MKNDDSMPEASLIHGVIVTHADLANALRVAAASVAGDDGALETVSNEGLSSAELGKRIVDAVERLQGASCIVMVDFQGGSCANACMAELHAMPNVRVISGINLPMLADFVLRRRDLALDPLVERMLERGHRSIQSLKGES